MPLENPNQSLFVYCPGCGHRSLFPRNQKSFSCARCGFLFYINCAAAAMALIFDHRGRLLVTVRKKDPARGTLDLPGGFIEPGETIEQGLVREVKEELNLEVTTLTYLCSFPNTYPYEKVTYPVADTAFVCKVEGFDTIRARDDIGGFEFLDPETFDTDRFGLDSPKKVIRFFLDRGSAVQPLAED